MGGAIYSEYIFQTEHNGEEPLGRDKYLVICFPQGGDAFQYNSAHTQDNHPKEQYIKCFSGRGIGTENDYKYPFPEIHLVSKL